MSKKIDLTGRVFGRLTVIREFWKQSNNHNRRGRSMCDCRCVCGNVITTRKDGLLSGHTQSCGCLNRDIITKHGMYKTPLYRIWTSLRNRCSNPKNPSYKDYGGRGIKVCERWAEFEAFYEDMAQGYKDGLQIDRIDNNGDYCPENCRWTSVKEQARNRRSTNYVKGMSLKEYCEVNGLRYDLTWQRVVRRGWSIEKAASSPLMTQFVRKRKG